MSLLTNLVSFWKLNGNSNDAQSSNNGSDTSITYGASTGIINQGANSGGSPSIISIGNRASLQITGSVSVSGWVKVTNFTGGFEFVNQQYTNSNSSPYQGYRLWNDGTTTTMLWDTNSGGSFARTTWTISALSTATWYHFCVTSNSAGGAGQNMA